MPSALTAQIASGDTRTLEGEVRCLRMKQARPSGRIAPRPSCVKRWPLPTFDRENYPREYSILHNNLADAMRAHPLGRDAAVIGEVREAKRGRVTLCSRFGGARVVDLIDGEQLPRIC